MIGSWQPLDWLPYGVKRLRITKYFNHPLDNLPNSLEVLIINNIYDNDLVIFTQPLNNLPLGLKYLELGQMYKFNYENYILDLPSTLEYLVIIEPYTKLIDLIDHFEYLKNNNNKLKIISELDLFQKHKHNLPIIYQF